MPTRIQLSRQRGWRMPIDAIKVDRSTRWGNPFRVGDEGIPDAAAALRLFRKLLDRDDLAEHHEFFVFTRERLRADLGGKSLACWCAIGSACHADELLRVANAEPPQ